MRGIGQIVVLVASEPTIENQAAEKVQATVSQFPGLNVVVVGAPELALIQQRMEQLGLGKLAKEVGLSGYGAIRNLGLLVADTLGFDAVVFLDDDEVVDDPDFLQRAVYGLGKLTKKGIPILAKTGYYFNSDGSYLSEKPGQVVQPFLAAGQGVQQVDHEGHARPTPVPFKPCVRRLPGAAQRSFQARVVRPWIPRGEGLGLLA